MAEGLNRVMVIGNMGADPELRYTQGGQAVLNLRLAINESYIDKDKVRRERTEWVSVVVWGARAEGLSKFLTKGRQIFVEGRLQTTTYDDKDGTKRFKTEVIAINVIPVGWRDGGQSEERRGYDRGREDSGKGHVPDAGEHEQY